MKIQVKTYSDALRLYRCMLIRKYASGISDETIADMYRFLTGNPTHYVGISDDMLYHVDASAKKVKTVPITLKDTADRIFVSADSFRVVNKVTESADSGCGGCSGNNNNNNNNG